MTNLEVIYGGSFDPCHLGHENIVNHLCSAFPDALVRLLPCSQPALKTRNIASFEQRKAMLKIAFHRMKNVFIDTRENYRQGKSYTFHSLKEISKEKKDRNLVFVVGADALQSMDKWFRYKDISKLCHLLIVARPGVLQKDFSNLFNKLGFLPAKGKGELAKQATGLYYCLPTEEKDISSTQIRRQIEHSRLKPTLLSKEIINYISDNDLYSSGIISS